MTEQLKSNEPDRIRALISKRESDVERWSQKQQLKTWEIRTRRAATFVRKASVVMDLGCGNMNLRDALPEGCTYIPADIVKRAPDCHVIELNKGQWPTATADVVTALGLLEYLYDLPSFFEGCARLAPRLIFSYHISYLRTAEAHNARMNMGWLNDFTLPHVVQTIIDARGRIDRIDGFTHKQHFTQYIFIVTFPGQEPPATT